MRLGFLIILFFASRLGAAQPLSGIYTIGGLEADFGSFEEAVYALNQEGVGEGGLEFILNEGVYTGNFEINATGTLLNPVLIRSADNDAESVAIVSGVPNDVITLNSSSYITFQHITFRFTGNSTNSTVQIGENSNHIQFLHCVFEGSTGSSTLYAASAIYAHSTAADLNCSDILVENSIFRYGSYGFCADMSGVTSDSIIVSNCLFENQYAGGIFMKDLYAPSAEANRIHTAQSGNTGYNGITWDNCDGPGRIIGNDIYTSSGGRANYGIELNGSAGAAGNEIIIANNSIEVNNQNSLCYGLAQSNNCNYYRIFHNLLFISGGSSSGSTPYQTFVFDGTTHFYNNILVSNSDGSTNRCVYIANQSAMAFIDYNCYWTMNAGSNFTGYFGGVENDFASYVAETGENYSLNFNPEIEFIDGKGWRATSESLLNTALFVENFSDDIDGNLRPDPPCIGANEVDQLTTKINPSIATNWYIFTEGKNVCIGGEIKGLNELFIVDLNGRLITRTSVFYSEGTVTIPLSDCSSGVYLLGLSADGRMEYKKFLYLNK